MNYIETNIYTTKEGIDPVTSLLIDFGIEGMVIEDATDFKELLEKKNSYDWDYIDESLMKLHNIETNITFYLEDTKENSQILESVKEEISKLATLDACGSFGDSIGLLGRLIILTKVVCDEDWVDNWKLYFKPGSITERFTVKPTWHEYESKREDELIIEIDPGMAFGTGKHPTSTLCVRLLEKYIQSADDAVLDIGCGSGILSIVAAMLGAKNVKGVELDPVAVEVAKENIALNGLQDQVEVILGDLTKGLDEKFDIIVANLMADLVIKLSGDVKKHLRGRKIYISSGVLIEKKEQVSHAIEECGFEILEILEEAEWCAIAAKLSH